MPYKARSILRCVFNIIFYLFSAVNKDKRIYLSLYCRMTREKIVLLLKMKVNTVNNHQILSIWNFVMKKALDLSEQNSRFCKILKVHLNWNLDWAVILLQNHFATKTCSKHCLNLRQIYLNPVFGVHMFKNIPQ